MPGLRPPRPMQRQTPARRPRHRYISARRSGLGWRAKTALGAGSVVVAALLWAVIARHVAPVSNTDRTRFDAIIVLGYRADGDGNPSPTQLARVTEAVREYDRGVAPRIILTGAAVSNRFVEAEVMAHAAEAQGIPASSLFIEPNARDIIQNACFAARIMKAHGWGSAEVISSAYHLPRAAMIFGRLPIEWRMHAAPPLEPPTPARTALRSTVDTLKTVRYLLYADWADRCEP